MNQFIGTVVTSAIVAFICTHTKFGKMTFSAVDEAIEHFAKLREWARNKRKEAKQKKDEKGSDTPSENATTEQPENM